MVENRQIFQEMDDIWEKISNLRKELNPIVERIWAGQSDSEDLKKTNQLDEEIRRLEDLRHKLLQQLISQRES